MCDSEWRRKYLLMEGGDKDVDICRCDDEYDQGNNDHEDH
jgi:hypothetical protein